MVLQVFSHAFDIVVYGSTSAAVSTAIQGARLGRKVALVSPLEHIGGIQIEGLGATDIDNQQEVFNSKSVGGLALELHRRISKHYGRLDRLDHVVRHKIKDVDVWRFESCVAERVIADWLQEHPNIKIFKTTSPSKGKKNPGSANRLEYANYWTCNTFFGNTELPADCVQYFVDASYEGDFLAVAGISTTYGREATSVYKESLAGVRASTTYRQFEVDVDPYQIPKDPSSGLLYGVSEERFGQPGDGDRHLQSFSYRVPLTDRADNRVPFSKPEGYDPSHYELHRRYHKAGGNLFTPTKRLPNDKTDLIGSEAALATDLLGMNDGWAAGTESERQRILEDTTRFTKGLFYFFATDESLPLDFRNEWSRFGYCLDEFPDNNHFPRMLYIRDARRMISDYVVTEHTASEENGEPPVHDPVAIAFWPTDTHSVRRIVKDEKVYNEGFIFKDGHRWRPFGISYRALVPKLDQAENLMTPTCPSSSHVGYGAVRLEHQFYALGQACANACDIALKFDMPLQKIPYSELEQRLRKQGVVLDVDSVGKPEHNFS